ncbi:NAD(P) transhydrogenase subunit alpha [Phaeodactylibacter luteus]|uniref:proton-translocating NAD(P)(+) transhydrogenase n=1 Tax=Phaeodactylibacter luteus TaxID=1564516 RepID=A0A5C6S4V7_9BACT|nr:NAD(P) transhydrogenase subunit alpha [Phaeodactylibacter luteus]TXB69443.1 NAD(P) transhydrogenase subunit alpha [Phaeodactylibacter luteus]
MKLAILKEPQGDARVALTPDAVPKLQAAGFSLLLEEGAGEGALFPDEAYSSVDVFSRAELLGKADILLSISPLPETEWPSIKPGAWLIAQFQPFVDESVSGKLSKAGLNAFSLDMIPRTTLAQSMDVLSSMAAVAGYKAVLEAARLLPRYFPMMITAAGSIRPATVLVLGAGVAGLQAIATARRLGAQVEAFDTRSAAKEEVKSLGAKFIEIEGAREDAGAGGYGVEQSEAFLQKQREEVQARAMKADVIITTAQVRGRKAPILVPASTVERMKPGSVIIDLASSTGGNCELSQDNELRVHHGISILGNSNLAALMPQDASQLYSNNVVNFLKYITSDGQLNLDYTNEIIGGACITKPAAEKE